MAEITKEKYGEFNFITIKTDTGDLEISFQGNLDLYWNYKSNKLTNDNINNKVITITREDYFLYEEFYKLFNTIKNNEVYFSYCNDNNGKKCENNEQIHKQLFHDNIIDYHSDDDSYDEASSFTIEEKEDSYIITFNLSKYEKRIFQTYAVRICNSGSRYGHFNIPFMQMYHSLLDYEYDPNYHQMNIEEYLHLRKLKKTKIKR